ncbi:MAG TPA: amidohydrolase [Bryobacterales bacterium]|nr:amidohydrolase [Bryobacterales bacterium]
MRFCFVWLSFAAAIPLAAANADLILHNGKIISVDTGFGIYQAVAVKGGKIAAVGSDRAVLGAERGPRTEIIDLHGRSVLPGLIDSHLHAVDASLSELRGPLPPLNSFAAIQNYIREEARKTPKGQWIIVPRTFPTRLKEMRMPTREVLDVATDHPVMFDASYVVVANSLALKISGIARDTPNPPGGVIVKDEHGEPNGILRNAQALLKGVTPRADFTEQEKLAALEQMLKRYVAAGLTSIGEGAAEAEDIRLYQKLKAEHRLPIRAVLVWWLDISRPTDDLVREIRAASYKTGDGDNWLKFGPFKVNVDGGMTIGTAYQRAPYGPFGRQLYGQTDPTNRGQFFPGSPAKLLAVMRAARDKGFSLTAHAQGGGAVDAFLDVLETLDRERPIRPTRSHLIHASFQSPAAIARMKRLGILADAQAAWLYEDAPALEQVFTHEGMRWFIPLRSYLDAGIVVSNSSDHMIGFDKNKAVNPYNPFLSMWIAVTRQTARDGVLYPQDRVSREEALKMNTIWPAYLQFAENAKGSIETGKLADMVVIDRDYLTCPEGEIKNIEPVMTILDGMIVYRRK